MRFATYIALVASLASSVYGHALITAATGANGVNGVGFGVVDGTVNCYLPGFVLKVFALQVLLETLVFPSRLLKVTLRLSGT
jgi:hypothetical protein